jgi:integrase
MLDGVEFSKREPHRREPLTNEEIDLIPLLPTPWREAATISLRYGFRLGDVLSLKAENFIGGQIVVYTDKHDKRLSFKWNDVSIDFSAYHFSNPSVSYREAARRVGIDKPFHCLRHTFASRQKADGKTLEEIRLKLGHSNVSTTQGYVHEGVKIESALNSI